MAGFLAKSDVDRLLADPSAQSRADLATTLAKEFEAGGLTPAERRLAEEIFRALTHDAAGRGRGALAPPLKETRDLPPDVPPALGPRTDSSAPPVLPTLPSLPLTALFSLIRP